MLSDFSSFFKKSATNTFLVYDEDYKQAVDNCYDALCYNNNQGKWYQYCDQSSTKIGLVITSYIRYFTTHPMPDKVKYYYDEFSDRSDPYRKQLVDLLSKSISMDSDFVNSVLSYLYWGIKRGSVAKGILQPLQQDKFKDDKWYLNGVWKYVFEITEAVINFMDKIFRTAVLLIDTAGNVVNGVVMGLSGILNLTGNLISYLPYIVCGGVVLFVGGQIYFKQRTGKFVGEDSARAAIKARTGIGDKRGYRYGSNKYKKGA